MVGLLFLARTCMSVQFHAIPPLSTLLVADLQINYAQLGLLIGIFFLPGGFLALPGGLLGSRYGSRTVLLPPVAGHLQDIYATAVMKRNSGGRLEGIIG